LPTALAAPAQDGTPSEPVKTNNAVNLYDKEKLEWQDYDLSHLFLSDDPSTARRWDPWHEAGQYARMAAHSACIGSGVEIEGATVAKHIVRACAALVGKAPGMKLINDGWKAWQLFDMPDINGKNSYINFRFRQSGDHPPSLTETICQKVLDDMTTNMCVGSDGDTSGATVAIGDGNGELQIGFDPNDQAGYEGDE
jgi:hypothetical protein